MTHKQLVDISYKWLLRFGGCGVAMKEIVCYTRSGEIPDVIGFASCESTLIECKISRADILRDRKKIFRTNPQMGIGLFRYYICPEGLIKPNELPEKWGLLYVCPKGKVSKVILPSKQVYCEQSEKAIMYSLLRRMNLKGYISKFYKEDTYLTIMENINDAVDVYLDAKAEDVVN